MFSQESGEATSLQKKMCCSFRLSSRTASEDSKSDAAKLSRFRSKQTEWSELVGSDSQSAPTAHLTQAHPRWCLLVCLVLLHWWKSKPFCLVRLGNSLIWFNWFIHLVFMRRARVSALLTIIRGNCLQPSSNNIFSPEAECSPRAGPTTPCGHVRREASVLFSRTVCVLRNALCTIFVWLWFFFFFNYLTWVSEEWGNRCVKKAKVC